jgi:hypothetical protein
MVRLRGPPAPECGSAPDLDAEAAHVDVVAVGFTEAQSQQRESRPARGSPNSEVTPGQGFKALHDSGSVFGGAPGFIR